MISYYIRVQESIFFPKIQRLKKFWVISAARTDPIQSVILGSSSEIDAITFKYHIPWRIHGAGTYANIKGVYWWDPWHTIYSSTMDPMGYVCFWELMGINGFH